MADTTNPFFSPSSLPYQLPPFAEIRDEHYRPAFERGFAEQLGEIDAITAQTDEPTFENTMLPLERSGQTLLRVAEVFFNKSSSDSSDFTNELEEEIAPRLAAHQDAIRLDPALYARIARLYEQLDDLGLDPESRYLVERYHAEFTLAGAGLSDADKDTLRDLNQRLSTLTTRFEKNLLADTNELAVVFDDSAELAGLDEGALSATREAAAERGLDGKHVVTLVLPTGHPYLASLERREVRERIMTASRARGIHGGPHDNRDLVLEITRLRAERARLLGFENHAAYVTADQTARNPRAVADMLGRLAPAAARNARSEQADRQEQLRAQLGGDTTLAAWDWAYFTEKVRQQKYDVDVAAMRPY
ncbi:MAG TPA: M3 family metallopeptidase, partial [Leifsonia sp.]